MLAAAPQIAVVDGVALYFLDTSVCIKFLKMCPRFLKEWELETVIRLFRSGLLLFLFLKTGDPGREPKSGRCSFLRRKESTMSVAMYWKPRNMMKDRLSKRSLVSPKDGKLLVTN